jgi:hypothetical protein
MVIRTALPELLEVPAVLGSFTVLYLRRQLSELEYEGKNPNTNRRY